AHEALQPIEVEIRIAQLGAEGVGEREVGVGEVTLQERGRPGKSGSGRELALYAAEGGDLQIRMALDERGEAAERGLHSERKNENRGGAERKFPRERPARSHY